MTELGLRRGADNVDLGTACGRFYRVGCLSITDPGAPHPICTCTCLSCSLDPQTVA